MTQDSAGNFLCPVPGFLTGTGGFEQIHQAAPQIGAAQT
jgi:hypothetical protein